MSADSIGIQTIMPKTGTSPQTSPTANASRAPDYADRIAEALARQAPPPLGMGKLVDKTV
jgi:hypothetical protein